LLEKENLGQHWEKFQEAEATTLADILDLTEADLTEMGLKVAPKRRIFNMI